jgi:hypothetical protein
MFPSDLQERASRLGAFLSMQPNFTDNWQGPGGLYEQVLGPDRARALNPYVDAYRTGRLLFGSDTMPLGPARGLRGALRHPDPAQRLDLSSALHSYGAGAAAATRSPFHQARIAEGEPADLVIVAPGESGWGGTADASVPVLATVLGGTVRFERNGAVR